jgi:L-amino acid N-acyltransferase YncA
MIREASSEDGAACAAIYRPAVEGSTATFELGPPSAGAMAARIQATTAYPWLVCERDGEVAGYAYASAFRKRAAYQWAAETSVYVHPGHQREGVASALYEALLACLRAQGYVHAYGVLTLPNPASVALHEAFGFDRVGTLPGIGYKHGDWQDVSLWHLPLRERPADPRPPSDPDAVRDRSVWQTVLSGDEDG